MYISFKSFWKHIWEIKNIDEAYDVWEQKQNTKKIFSTLDYTIFNEDMVAIFDEDDVSINKKDFFKDYKYTTSINFLEYNLEKLADTYNSVKNDIEKYIWYQCNNKEYNQIKYLDKKRTIHWDNDISTLFYSYNFYIEDYENELWKKLKEFNFEKEKIYEIINKNEINEEEIYQNNCLKYSKEELDIIEQRYDTRSLLYFDNTENRIREFIENHEKNKTINRINKNFDNLNNDNFEWKKLEITPNK